MTDFDDYMQREFEHLYRAHQKLLTDGAPSLSESEGESAWAYSLMKQAWDAKSQQLADMRDAFNALYDMLDRRGYFVQEYWPDGWSLEYGILTRYRRGNE